jgi:hypothetical protein
MLGRPKLELSRPNSEGVSSVGGITNYLDHLNPQSESELVVELLTESCGLLYEKFLDHNIELEWETRLETLDSMVRHNGTDFYRVSFGWPEENAPQVHVTPLTDEAREYL